MHSDTMTASDVLDALAADADIPVITGLPVIQGDVAILPAVGAVPDATQPLPAQGAELVRGQGGHVHLLLGKVLWAPGPDGAQTVGTITVPDGEVGYLAHGDGSPVSALSRDAEHALDAFGPGTWVVRRQRVQADEERLVAD
jgi:hypothetical protein